MGKNNDVCCLKTDAPVMDTKTSPPSSSWLPMGTGMPTSLTDVVKQTNLDSSGINEVLNAGSLQQGVVETITHPVILAVVVGASLMLLSRR